MIAAQILAKKETWQIDYGDIQEVRAADANFDHIWRGHRFAILTEYDIMQLL
jgi:hypothetical protein